MRRPFVVLIVIACSFLAPGCGVPEAEHNRVKTENAELKRRSGELERQNAELKTRASDLERQVDELKFGAERMSALIRKAIDARDYTAARATIKQLAEKHPEAAQNAEFTALLPKLDADERAAKEKAAADEKERARLANLQNTGMWAIRAYVDEFRSPTAQKYIGNNERIIGTFSNSITDGSSLGVDLLIDSPTSVAIMLYEYARETPFKGIVNRERYKIAVQDREGKKYYYTGTLHTNRIRIDDLENSGGTLMAALTKGGIVKFRITDDRGLATYSFEIEPQWFDNALRIFNEQAKAK